VFEVPRSMATSPAKILNNENPIDTPNISV
jgi:hypothetical protein